jgi:hypothetical protein
MNVKQEASCKRLHAAAGGWVESGNELTGKG